MGEGEVFGSVFFVGEIGEHIHSNGEGFKTSFISSIVCFDEEIVLGEDGESVDLLGSRIVLAIQTLPVSKLLFQGHGTVGLLHVDCSSGKECKSNDGYDFMFHLINEI